MKSVTFETCCPVEDVEGAGVVVLVAGVAVPVEGVPTGVGAAVVVDCNADVRLLNSVVCWLISSTIKTNIRNALENGFALGI